MHLGYFDTLEEAKSARLKAENKYFTDKIPIDLFEKYLITDDDICLNSDRIGGFGSSGK